MKHCVIQAAAALLLTSGIALAQPADDGKRFIDVTVGMGIDMQSAISLANYINQMAQPRQDERLYDYSSAVEFFAVPEVQVAREWSVGLEYAMLIKSYSIDDRSGYSRSDFSFNVHMPTVLVHWLLLGDGYRVKLGGGAGYHLASLSQSFLATGGQETVTAEGFGLKLDAVGNTKFDDTMYGSIALDLRLDRIGTFKHAANATAASASIGLPTMNFFSAGLKFGITFQLN